jgi:hypothetical protein
MCNVGMQNAVMRIVMLSIVMHAVCHYALHRFTEHRIINCSEYIKYNTEDFLYTNLKLQLLTKYTNSY